MDLYLISVLIFVAFLVIIVYRDRKNFTRESIFLLRKTQRGKNLITKIGTSFPRFWKVLGFISVATGFIVSILGLKMLFDNLMTAISTKVASPSLALLIPSPTAQPVLGYGYLAVPFWYWIICLALLALVHEGFHGIFSVYEKVRIKSLGFGILAIIPLAFVEPDEKQLMKKGVWPALRVFSAGSFANFLLAAFSLIVIIWMATTIYVPTGVDFGMMPPFTPYHAKLINVSSVQSFGGSQVSSIDEINGTLADFGENDTITVETGNGTYYFVKRLLASQITEGAQTLIVFDDFPAASVGLKGTIIKVNGDIIKDSNDLTLALEKYGPNSEVKVTTKTGDINREFVLTTKEKGLHPAYVPDSFMMLFTSFEHIVPGSVEFYLTAGESWMALLGQKTVVTWDYIQNRIGIWEWVKENNPALKSRATENINLWESKLIEHPRPGYLGIVGVLPHIELVNGLEGLKQPIDFIQGLLFFLFIINLGVGIVNLLPLKPLDGGRLWDITLRRYLPPKLAKRVVRALGLFTFLLLILNFIPFGIFL